MGIDISIIQLNATLGWIAEDLVDGKLTSVHVMAWLGPSGNNPMPEAVLNKIPDAIWRH